MRTAPGRLHPLMERSHRISLSTKQKRLRQFRTSADRSGCGRGIYPKMRNSYDDTPKNGRARGASPIGTNCLEYDGKCVKPETASDLRQPEHRRQRIPNSVELFCLERLPVDLN